MQEAQVRSLGGEGHLKKKMAIYSILAWETPWQGAWWATKSMESQKNWTQLNNNGKAIKPQPEKLLLSISVRRVSQMRPSLYLT